MEKLYKLKEEVFKYIHKTSENSKSLPLKEWLDKGYNTNSLEEFNNHFKLGYNENGRNSKCYSEHLSSWQDNVSEFYFTLFVNQNYECHNLLNNNRKFKENLIKEMNLAFEKAYNEFNKETNK